MKNILRVWKGVEEEAAKLQEETKPAWEWVPIDEDKVKIYDFSNTQNRTKFDLSESRWSNLCL